MSRKPLAVAADREEPQPGGEHGQKHEPDKEDRRGQADLEDGADDESPASGWR